MRNLGINRTWFWILVAVFFVIKIPLDFYLVENLGRPHDFASLLDTLLVVALAATVGGRLHHAGSSGGVQVLAILATFLIIKILPSVLLDGYLAKFGKPLQSAGGVSPKVILFVPISVTTFAVLFVVLLWAGTRPRAPQPSAALR